MTKPILKLDWIDAKAARYACERWHYSGTMPVTKTARIGVWENGVYLGCLIFSCGAGAACDGTKYGLAKSFEMAELQRVALRKHVTPVSRMMAIAVRMIRAAFPKIRMLISFADPSQGHAGIIYQAMGWTYAGMTAGSHEVKLSDGRWVHPRTINNQWGDKSLAGRLEVIDKRRASGKHRYLMPLDDEMRQRIAPLAKPYPKRARSADSGTSGFQPEGGGATPTRALSTGKKAVLDG